MFEEPLIDWRQTLSARPLPPQDNLALIAIDHIPNDRPWPWPRLDYALLLHSLLPSVTPYSPQSVVFEMLLNDRDTEYSSFDAKFGDIVDRYGRVVFAGAVLQRAGNDPAPKNLTVITCAGNLTKLPLFNSLFWPLDTFAGSSAVGISNLQADSSDVIRRVPLVFRFEKQTTPSLALQAVAMRLGADWKKSEVRLGEFIFLRNSQGALLRSIPIDDQGRLYLRARMGQPEWPKFSFDNVFVYADQLVHGETVDGDFFRKIHQRQVWVGRTDQIEMQPLFTPAGRTTPVEVQMTIVSQILQNDFVQPVHPLIFGIIFIVLGMTGSVFFISWGELPGLVFISSMTWALVEVSVILFRTNNLEFPLISTILLALGVILVGFAVNNWDIQVGKSDKQLPLKLK